MSDTQPIEGQEQPTAEAERDALLSRVRELAVLVRSSDISKSQLLSDYSAGEADGLGLALLVMCGGEGVKEEYARASRKLRKLLGWRPMNELPPGDGEYPIQTINGTRDMIRYTRAFGWHFPKPSLLAGWFLLPPWPGEEPQ